MSGFRTSLRFRTSVGLRARRAAMWVPAFATALLVVRGGENVGPMMEHLRLYLPGYTVSSTGAVLGGVQLGIVGYLVGHLVAVLYNRICKRMTRAGA